MASNEVSKIFTRQTKYALRVYPCLPLLDGSGQEVPGAMFYVIEKPYVLLHAFVADSSIDTDRENELSQGLSNALLFLENHPVVQVAAIADISSFHAAPGKIVVNDLREGKATAKQFVFVLQCLNF